MPHIAIDYDKEKLRDFCRKWKITLSQSLHPRLGCDA
jgi:hypothetical protein